MAVFLHCVRFGLCWPRGLIVPQPATARGVAAVISVSSDGKFLIYTNGNNVIIRSVEDPTFVTVYSEHSSPVKVAKFSPNVKWVASGDEAGKVRIWAWTRADHLLKLEADVLGGPVEDLAWDFENKRLFAVGAGSNKAKFFMFDTGSNLGDVVPMSKKGLSCDLKPNRPFAAACGGEDFQLQFYTGGPPFKYAHGMTEHTNFVNCVRYAPDGSRFVSVSSDKQGIVYDGKTGDVIGRLDAAGQHTGSIYHCSWSPDGSQLVTSGADKCLKYWDMASLTCVKTVTLGAGIADMQNSVFWSTGPVVSLSLDGALNFFRPLDDTPSLIVRGHQAPITAFAFDVGSGKLFTICSGGRLFSWVCAPGTTDRFVATPLPGEHHGGKGVAVAIAGAEVATIAWDDKLRIAEIATEEFIAAVPTEGQPRGVAVSATNSSLQFVITSGAIKSFLRGVCVSTLAVSDYAPTAISASADGSKIAVGGDDAKVHLYSVGAGGVLTATGESRGVGTAISVIAFSPDGSVIVTGDTTRDVRLYSGVDVSVLKSGKWQAHTTRVTGLAWHPSGSVFVTVSTDRRICIWNPADDRVVKTVDLAHAAPLSCVGWQNETTFWTLSTDGIMKRWKHDA